MTIELSNYFHRPGAACVRGDPVRYFVVHYDGGQNAVDPLEAVEEIVGVLSVDEADPAALVDVVQGSSERVVKR